MSLNLKKIGIVFMVVLMVGMCQLTYAQISYAERLSKLEDNLGTDTQSGMYSQNFKVSQQITAEGVRLFQKGDMDGAELKFNEAVTMSDFAYVAYAYLGMVEFGRGNLEKSISYHEKAMDTFRKYKKHVIARKREFIKDLNTKVVYINNVLDKRGLNFERTTNNMNLANSFMWQEIREKNPTYHMTKVNDLIVKVESLEKELLQDLRMSYPAFLLVQYGNSFQAKGELTNALEAYKNALRVDPQYGLAYSNIASCFVAAGEIDLAKQYYKDAKRLNAEIHPAVEKALH